MPIHDFNSWANNFILISNSNNKPTLQVQIEALTDLLLKAYELGRNPNVEKLDK